MKLGDFQLRWLQGGEFELDGGTMFGVVPKVLWSRKYPSEDNYIRMLNAPMLLQTPDANIIIETGVGNKLTEKQKKIFRITAEWDMPEGLAKAGLTREDIDYVILTHCDFDHAGGVVMHNASAEAELTFPRAKHIVQRIEWEDAQSPNIRSKSTYFPENFAGLQESGNLVIIDGEHELLPGVRLVHTGGHTLGHQVVWMESQGETALHMADLLPTHVHFNPLWVMAYDNFPMAAIECKQRLNDEGRAKNAWFTFYHDPFLMACRFDEKGNVTDKIEESML